NEFCGWLNVHKSWCLTDRYEGETCEGQFHGEGVAFFKGGHIYTGEVYNGIRHGIGTYKCPKNNEFYRGQWNQGKRHGKGTVYYNEDKTSWYKGDWVKNNREGWGVRCYPSGNIYSGDWKNDLRHGEGAMKWLKQGQEYVGTWQDGVQESQYFQSNHYKGDFIHVQRHGQGTFYYASGAIYEGEWRNCKKHGQVINYAVLPLSINLSKNILHTSYSFPPTSWRYITFLE
uniref:Radial spoke head component 1 n=1 Tax=Amphiprion percula TaxID=161767 RepID=A0A3P8RLX9_AMPPE